MRNVLKDYCRERGQIFAETAIALPLIAALIVTVIGLFGFSWRFYRQNMADIELQSEIRLAMERIVEDASRSRSFVVESGTLSQIRGSRLTFRRVNTGVAGSENEVTYFLRDDASGVETRLCRNASNAPITGASKYGEVTVTKFVCARDGARLRVELTGRSKLTGRDFSLCTEIYMGD